MLPVTGVDKGDKVSIIISIVKVAVYTVWIFIKSCMFLELFLFAKKMKFLTKGRFKRGQIRFQFSNMP